MRYLTEIALAVCFLLVSSAAAASSWKVIEGTENKNGNISIKCEAGSGWRKCGGKTEPKEKVYLLGVHSPPLNGRRTLGFIFRGKILEIPSGVEVRCYTKDHAAQYKLKGVQICEDMMDGMIVPGFIGSVGETLSYTYKLSSAPLSKDVITCSTLYPFLGVSPFPTNKAHPYFLTCGSDLVDHSVKSNLVSKEYGINKNYRNIVLPQPTISIELNSSKGKRYRPVRLAAMGSSLAINYNSSSASFAYELEEVK